MKKTMDIQINMSGRVIHIQLLDVTAALHARVFCLDFFFFFFHAMLSRVKTCFSSIALPGVR